MAYSIYVLVISIILLFVYLRNYLRTVWLVMSLKGPEGIPLLGHVFLMKDAKRLWEIATNAYDWYGPLLKCWVVFMPFICIYEPNHLKVILGSSKNSKKNFFYDVMHNFIGRGLITNNGNEWRRNRKLIQPYFNMNILERYIGIFSDNSSKLVETLNGYKDVNITSFINNCVLGILHEAILGVPLDHNSPYRKGEALLTERVTKPWLLLETIFKLTTFAEKEAHQKLSLHNYTKKVLVERKRHFEKSSLKCLMDMFIQISENDTRFTDDNIINEAVTFMLAGQDSVGSALAFSLFFLAKHQDVQQKVYDEIEGLNYNHEKLTLTDLNELKYLEQVIKETLRLTPSVPVLSRILTEDIILDGKTIPVGTNLFISPWVTHLLQQYFPDPLKFDPDRFSIENSEKLHPYCFLPFSMGPRNCIGYKFALLEIKTILFTFLTKFHVTSKLDRQNFPEFSYRATLRAKGGIHLHLNPRNNSQT